MDEGTRWNNAVRDIVVDFCSRKHGNGPRPLMPPCDECSKEALEIIRNYDSYCEARDMRERKKARQMAYGMSETVFHQLADYNAEVARGIVHTEEWDARMAELQKRFDAASAKLYGTVTSA